MSVDLKCMANGCFEEFSPHTNDSQRLRLHSSPFFLEYCNNNHNKYGTDKIYPNSG